MKKLFLILLVATGGMTSLALEMCISRFLGAYFGSSLIIWGLIIGLVLSYLTIGHYLGGRQADRHPSYERLCLITTIAALFILLVPFAGNYILSWSVLAFERVDANLFVLSLLGILLLFAVPVILLGMVTPFAVRLLMKEPGRGGHVSGLLYAISTFGSLIGVFMAVLWLTPTFGVRRSILVFGALLLAASLWGLRARLRPIMIVALVLVMIPLGPLKQTPGLIYEHESFYNYIQVTEDEQGTRRLLLNEGQGVHSIAYSDPERILTGVYWDYFLSVPYFNQNFQADQLERVAFVGLAAGTIAQQFTHVYGPIPIDGVEIDPAIVEVGRTYFGMDEPNIHVYEQDGRAFIKTTQKSYDLIGIDAIKYPYIPFQLTTQEFFQEIKARLSPTGTVVLNAFQTPGNNKLVQALVNTLQTVFPSIYLLEVPGALNVEIVATMQQTSIEDFQQNMDQFDPESTMGQVAQIVKPIVKPAVANDGLIFTDNRAPIEQITDQVFFYNS